MSRYVIKFIYLNYSLIKEAISFIIETYFFIEDFFFLNIKNENYTFIIKIENKVFIISEIFFASIIKNENEIFIINFINKKKKVIKLSINSAREINIEYIFRSYYYIIIKLKLLLDKKIK